MKKLIVALFVCSFSIVLSSCKNKDICKTEFTGFYTNSGNDCTFEIVLTRLTFRGSESCDAFNAVMNHTISSLSIKTIYDYSNDYLAGSDITALFLSEKYGKNESISIDELILLANNDVDRYSKICFFLADDEYKAGKQKFEIRILLSDGKELVNQTDDL